MLIHCNSGANANGVAEEVVAMVIAHAMSYRSNVLPGAGGVSPRGAGGHFDPCRTFHFSIPSLLTHT